MRKKSANKKFSHYLNSNKAYKLNLCKGERPVKRNKSGFIAIKPAKTTKHFDVAFNTKSDSSFSSQEFDNYYDNFLKSLQEESAEKVNSVHNPLTRKEKHNHSGKSSGVSPKAKVSPVRYKPYALLHQKSEHNIDLHKTGNGNLPEIKISPFDGVFCKVDNSIENSVGLLKPMLHNEEMSTQHQMKSCYNDTESKFTYNNKQLECDLIPSETKSIINCIPTDINEHNIEMMNSNFNMNNIFKNSQVTSATPKSNVQSMQESNLLRVKQAENFTLGEQIFIHKNHSKEYPSTPKAMNNANVHIKPYKLQNNNEIISMCPNNNLLNVNVMQVNSINNFNNAQKINLSKNRSNTPLNGNSMNGNKSKGTSKGPSPRYQFDYQSVSPSFDKASKKNEIVFIHKTNSKHSGKKGSNKNSYNNFNVNYGTPIMQCNQVPSQKNEDNFVLSSEMELKEKTKRSNQENQIVLQQSENLQVNEVTNLKTKKYFFCIPCK